MALRRGDIFINDHFKMIYKILDFERGNRIRCEYTRNGQTIEHVYEADVLLKSLTDPSLFRRVQIEIFKT